MSTRVYRYGLGRPGLNAAIVHEQIRLAHRYRNTMIELERGKRAALRATLEPYADLRELEARAIDMDRQCGEQARAIKAARVDKRTRKADCAEMTTRLRALRSELSGVRKALAARRAELRADPDVMVAEDEIKERRNELRRSAREYSGLRHGTYTQMEQAAAQADTTTPLWDGHEPQDPRFARWTGEGSIGVQIQGGVAESQIFDGAHTFLQIDRPHPECWGHPSKGERRRLQRTVLRMRVGSTEDRAPVWAEWPMTMHRPLPPGSSVKFASVKLERRGPREEWCLLLTVSIPGEKIKTAPEAAVAVDLGWRVMGDKIRVARWSGTDGTEGELRLSARDLDELRKPEDLHAVRERNFNAARDAFRAWLNDPASDVPQWLRDATGTIAHWRAPGKLAALAHRCAREGLVSDDHPAAFAALEAWRYHDHHLWAWEASQQTGSKRRLREIYRVFAAGLARRYQTVVLEDFDLRDVSGRERAEKSEQAERANANRHMLAPSTLRGAIENAFGPGRIEWVAAQDSTHECHACGHVDAFDAAAKVRHQCSACGAEWDQDANAARVLCERRSGAPKARPARKEKSKEDPDASLPRWERARKKRAERLARIEAARNAIATAAE